MLHLMMQPSDVLFLRHLMVRVCLLLLQSLRGQAQAVVGPSQPVVSILGDDVTLPCHLKPAVNALDLRLEWARPDLRPGFVHVWANGQERVADKQSSYRGRTSLSPDGLEHGDVSLTLSRVKLSDEGTYRCLVPSLGQATFIKLVVGAVSSPVIHMTKLSSQLLLQCESKGWYPEPEVLWLDVEGNLLPAGPTETVRGPDGLYTVSSRVTVEKRHSNSFTCRVQQKIINQTRETHIHVPVLSWKEKFVLTLGFIGVILCAVFSVHHWTLSLRKTNNVCAATANDNSDRKSTGSAASEAPTRSQKAAEERAPLNGGGAACEQEPMENEGSQQCTVMSL